MRTTVNPFKRRLTRKITRERLAKFLQAQSTDVLTLDVGAAARLYQPLFPRSYAGDIKRYPAIDLLFDAHHLPFADESFMCILCTEVLEHCINPARAIEEFHRVLKPDGKLILTTRFIFPIHDAPHDYFRFTRYGLQYLCRMFSSVSLEPETTTVEAMAVLNQRLAAQADWRLPGIKLLLQVQARILLRLRGLLKTEYADISKRGTEHDILASGYYLIAIK
jgi:SAM-dependent methyltransferase